MEPWLMLAGVDEDQFAGSRIPMSALEISAPRALRGVAFPIDQREIVLTHLGLTTVYTMVPTNRTDVLLLEPGQPREVTKRGSDLEQWPAMKPIFEAFAQQIGRNIEVANPHNHSRTPKQSAECFYVYFWSAPVDTPAKTYRLPVWGSTIRSSQHDGLEASGQGFPIVSAEGEAVAELVEDTLYILFDLPHPGTDAAPVLQHILDEVQLLLGSGTHADYLHTQAERRRTQSRSNYIAACLKRSVKDVEQEKANLTRSRERKTEYSQGLVGAVRDEAQALRRLEVLRSLTPGDTHLYEQEYDRLITLPGVIGLEVDARYIRVFTEYLTTYRLSDGSIRDLGSYRLSIPIAGGTLLGHNLTRQINNSHHPHELGGGELCLGNITEGIAKLIAEYEFSIVVQMLLEFLRTINEGDSAGKRVWDWPVVTDPAIAAATPVTESVFDDDEGEDFEDYEDDEDEESDDDE